MDIEDSINEIFPELRKWITDYYRGIEDLPVKSKSRIREIFGRLPSSPPLNGESFEKIFGDFNEIIMPGITH